MNREKKKENENAVLIRMACACIYFKSKRVTICNILQLKKLCHPHTTAAIVQQNRSYCIACTCGQRSLSLSLLFILSFVLIESIFSFLASQSERKRKGGEYMCKCTCGRLIIKTFLLFVSNCMGG
jgi:hypothetical protein